MLKYLGIAALGLMTISIGCKPKKRVLVKKVKGVRVAYISGKGAYSEIGPLFTELYRWIGEKEIQPAGPGIGIYYDDPKKAPPEECRYDICVPIKEVELEENERVKVKELPEVEVAFLVHKGPYKDVGPVWGEVYSWIYRSGYKPAGPGREVYLNFPTEVPEDSLLTEIQVPIKK